MNPQDAQAAEYVAGIRRAYRMATDADVAAGRAWYPTAGRYVAAIARRTGVPRRSVAMAMASLSPRNPWPWNVQDAAALTAWHADGRTELRPTCTTFGSNVQAAADALADGRAAWRNSAPKVRSFVANILGDTRAVTVDVHATRAATLGTRDVPNSDREYAAIAEAYRIVAADYGETPRDLQAIVWLVAMREYGRRNTSRPHGCKRGTFEYVERMLRKSGQVVR